MFIKVKKVFIRTDGQTKTIVPDSDGQTKTKFQLKFNLQ